MGNSVWWHGWHPLFHLKSDRRESTITGVGTDKFPHVIWMYVGTKRISVHESTWCTSNVCDQSISMCGLSWWSVGWVGLCLNIFSKHDKWICQRIVNAAPPRHWWDVASDACQFHAAHSSHKCVSYFSCVLVFGSLGGCIKMDTLKNSSIFALVL